MKDFKHVVITRFNYPDDKKELLNDRMNIFKKYTLPNMQKQTCKDFTWVFITNKELDIEFENKKFMSLSSYKKWKEELRKNYEYIIETRLDNDDTPHPGFISSIQAHFIKKNFIIEFKGYRYDERIDQMYEDKLYNNKFTSPFISLVSNLKNNLYVFDFLHGDMCKHFFTLFKDQRMWVQNIHSSNKLMNKEDIKIIASRGRICNKPYWFQNLK